MAELYAIVGSYQRAELMLEAGVPYLQLRFKTEILDVEEIQSWRVRYPQTRIIVNDDLELAEKGGAWGVHLGQADLDRYPKERVKNASLSVGISTHTDNEIFRAMEYAPALLGFGPIFTTQTKVLTHQPQGLKRLAEVMKTSTVPLVAIGGIDESNFKGVTETKVAMVAMISFLDQFHKTSEIQSLMNKLQA